MKKDKAPPHELEVKQSGTESKEDKPKVHKQKKSPNGMTDREPQVSQKENLNPNASSKKATSPGTEPEPSKDKKDKPKKEAKEKKAKEGKGEMKEDGKKERRHHPKEKI